jgi:hypothetical protein
VCSLIVVTLSDAILLFSKWVSESTDVICIAESLGWNCIVRGTVSPHPDGFQLSSPGGSGLKISLVDSLVFEYGQASELPQLGSDASGLVVSMPLRVDPNGSQYTDRLLFIELPLRK